MKPAEVGCIRSHKNVLVNAKSDLILVLEDDFELCENFDTELQAALNELPDNWNGLWLGGRLFGERKEYSERLLSITGITGSYGYLVKKEFAPAIIAELDKENLIADWAMMNAFVNVFKTKKNLVKHRAGYSYIQNKHVEYKDLQ